MNKMQKYLEPCLLEFAGFARLIEKTEELEAESVAVYSIPLLTKGRKKRRTDVAAQDETDCSKPLKK